MRTFYLISVVAFQDYVKDVRHNIVGIVLVAAILTPLLVLFGLKNGIILELVEALRSDPVARELRPLGQGEYGQAFFEELRAREDVGFVVEDTRFLAASISVQNPENRRMPPIEISMVPTAAGDPLWSETPVWKDDIVGVVLSRPLADRLKVTEGDRLRGRIGRIVDGNRQAVNVSLSVAGILPVEVTRRMMFLTPLEFLLETEKYREGFSTPRLGAESDNMRKEIRTFASFRLYAKRIEDVEPLRKWLINRQINSKTALDKIKLIETLNSSLSKLFWLISTFSIIGYVFIVGAQSSLVVIRKTRDLGILKLLGFGSDALVFFPVIQSFLTALIGGTVAAAVYYASEEIVNTLVQQLNIAQGVTSHLPLSYSLLAILMTISICVIIAIIGGIRASRIEPAEGLRQE